MDSNGISPASLSVSGYSQYPTPPPAPQEMTASEGPKKKRKAWGQPVPEIKQILPPRKRAKTAEEKEQRKNERILRNRRAADKSRQRQKAAVAELEAKAARMEQEMAALRATVAGYQERFGVQKDLDQSLVVKDESPSLGPALGIKGESKSEESAPAAVGSSTPVVTQYPAAILCDLQCQTACGATSLSTLPFQLGLSRLLQLICWMTYQTYSTSTLLPMYQIFQILEQKLATTSVDQTFHSLLSNFPLIHSLISMPSTSTRPAVFRMKLLSRLLACSPLMARLLMAATERALQQAVSDDGFVHDPDRRWTWASLMAIKWGIIKLEREHRRIRRAPQETREALRCSVMDGVDFGALIAPGSQITAAQLGLPESFTPPRWRFPSRMFPGERQGEWEPVKIQTRIRRKEVSKANGDVNGTESKEVEMSDAPAHGEAVQSVAKASVEPDQPAPANGNGSAGEPDATTTTIIEEESFEADPYSGDGAVYPIVEGRIENWSCFFALLSYIHKVLSPHFHSPLLMVAQPAWSARDKEIITQFVFENWKVPAFCMFDAALAAAYAYSTPSALVVDVGLDKCDVTAVTEFVVNDQGRAVALKDAGGRALTRRLLELLQSKGFDESMAEQLKKSPICEILPPGSALPSEQPVANASATAAANIGASDSAADPKGENEEDNEGVLDVAAIVARDNAAELLAKREAEKAAKAAAKKGGVAEAPKVARLKNAERAKAVFTYEELVSVNSANGADSPPSRKRKREIEVGPERFMAATPLQGYAEGMLEKIAAAVHRTVLAVHDPTQRPALWDNLIVLGNGARTKGFTQALVSTLSSRYTLSPSTATIFTSELPSNFTTPVATPGTNTPVPGHPPHPMSHPASHGVNPLLVAATRNVMQPHAGQVPQHLQVPGTHTPLPDPTAHSTLHRGFSQSPTTIKTAKAPEYFPEWKDPAVAGMEEAAFLGAQVAAKVVFITDQGASKGFMTRTEYNDVGPSGIHECAL
ncbi:hypothetical protein DV737_g2836, partial [Chaetothyriales sp. CBS 132003]